MMDSPPLLQDHAGAAPGAQAPPARPRAARRCGSTTLVMPAETSPVWKPTMSPLQQPSQPAFPIVKASFLLTATALLAAGPDALGLDAFFGWDGTMRDTLLLTGLVAWLSALVGLVPVALLGPRGVLPTVTGYFLGMGIRMGACLGAGLLGVYIGGLPAKPVGIALTVFYLPLLLVEVGMVGRYLSHKDAPSASSMPTRAKETHA